MNNSPSTNYRFEYDAISKTVDFHIVTFLIKKHKETCGHYPIF